MVEKIKGVVKLIIELGLYLVALCILLQVLFGKVVPFFGTIDVVGQITGIIATLGSNGLVGLLALGVIVWLFNKSGVSK
jgi:hypothetical protein